MAKHEGSYYVPESSHWPAVGAIGLLCFFLGIIMWLHHHVIGPWLFLAGCLIVVYMMFGWFGNVIWESQKGLYNKTLDRSFRFGMMWFIFSEVMFFAAFFGVLFYTRMFTLPWLAGHGDKSMLMTHYVLWPNFKAQWPLLHNPNPAKFLGAKAGLGAWGIATFNTAVLLLSGITVTLAHWALKKAERGKLILWLGITVLLGIIFLVSQAHEYYHAYTELGMRLSGGIYTTTFFMLTGFHGAHVTIGTIMLIVTWFRCKKGHFTKEHHFAFEAVSWYWHFVDVVWLLLFIFVYWL